VASKQFFPHDISASRDFKIIEMLGRYGARGYGAYWLIVEMLANESERKLPRKKWILKSISQALYDTELDMGRFITDAIEIGLFQSDENYFWSNSLTRRLDELDKKENEKKSNTKEKNNKEKNTDTNTDTNTDKDLSYISNRLDTRYGAGNQTVENDGLIDMIEDGDDKIRNALAEIEHRLQYEYLPPQAFANGRKIPYGIPYQIEVKLIEFLRKYGNEIVLRAVDTAITNTVGKYLEKPMPYLFKTIKNMAIKEGLEVDSDLKPLPSEPKKEKENEEDEWSGEAWGGKSTDTETK